MGYTLKMLQVCICCVLHAYTYLHTHTHTRTHARTHAHTHTHTHTQGYWQPEGDINRYHVAIKVLNQENASPEASKELLQEGIVMASMDHENVVRLYSVSMGKELMLISQFVPLGSLLSFLKKNRDELNAQTMLTFAVQIAMVSVLHTHKCTHVS